MTDPHVRPPYGIVTTIAKILYLYVDYVLGWVVLLRSFARAGGWVVLERGWWDLAVDPRRYRLRGGARLIRLLGRALPHPDLVVVLDAPPRLLASRKEELPVAELERQLVAWRTVLPPGQKRVRLDASLPTEDLVALTARELPQQEADGTLEDVPPAGWVNLPGRRRPRWTLPRGPRRTAAAALRIYHPVTLRGVVAWRAARVLARWGFLRLLPPGRSPPQGLMPALRTHIAPGSTVATAALNHPGRYAALVLDGSGRPRAIAKVTLEPWAPGALDREARILATLGGRLPDPLTVPRILARDDRCLLLEAAVWRPRLRPWRLPDEVAFALGSFFRGVGEDGTEQGFTHGDFAPWNLLRDGDRWVVVDWEEASPAGAPFEDLFHYLVQGHTLLRHPTKRQILSGLVGRGWVGRAIRAYADGALLPRSQAEVALVSYLESSREALDPSTAEGRRGISSREALLAALGMRNRVPT